VSRYVTGTTLATQLRVNVGKNIGQYRILRKIGAGGMGTVYLGEHILLKRRAAIKTLLPLLSVQPEIVDRFFNEARATAAISDPGVVQIFDFGYHVDGTAYIVMEFLEGEALSARIDRLGKLALASALRIARQVAGALASAHAHHIIHRDLKPDNIILIHDAEAQDGERAKILDFGICKLGGADAAITQSGAVLGTPVYMSPEQCRGKGGVDQRSDIYALGCGLFHMLTGRPPFECEGAGEFIVAHIQTPAPAPSTVDADLPASIDALVLRCLAKNPADRFQSMGELQVAIEAVLGTLGTPKSAPIPWRPLLVLGDGFKSAYDANFGTALPTRGAEASQARRGRPPLVTPTPTTIGSASGQTHGEPPRPSERRAMLAVLLLVGVLGGLVGTRVAIGEADDDPASSAVPAGSAAAGAMAVAEPAHVEPAATSRPLTQAPEPPPRVPVTIQLDPEPDRAAPASAPRESKKPVGKRKATRTRASRVAPTQPPSTPSIKQKPTTEDLYDTR